MARKITMNKKIIYLSIIFACQLLKVNGQHGVWENGLPEDPEFFPIAVWLQDPADASAYEAGGINLYIGLWQGPTEDQLSSLREAGMPVMCTQNTTGLDHLDDSIIVGWTQQDEPDNAQADGSGGYDPCIDPEIITGIYDSIRKKDPTRPVYLNLGQGVSYTDWVGRGECTGDTWMYPFYIEGCDIVSFDIYPVTSRYDLIRNNLWYVADGIDNLRLWSEDSKPVWCWIETTHINSENKPEPYQVKAEVWMALIHGAKGFGYFCHEWVPAFNANALLDDPVMFPAVTKINAEIHQLAPVLNSPDIHGMVSVESSNTGVPVDILVKTYQDTLYIFTAAMRDASTTATFTIDGTVEGDVYVIGEDRDLLISGDTFEDHFNGYEVHLYKAGLLNTGVKRETENAFRIFPNPCSGYLTIDTDLRVQYLSLISMTGKIIEIPAFKGDNKLDVSLVHPGPYIIQVQTINELYHQKIFIQHVF
jgi:hypothetical protein